MSQSPPAAGFKWLDPVKFNLDKYDDNISKGCALEVNLEYSKELKNLHNDYPVAPDKLEIKKEIFSDYQKLLITVLFALVILKN